MLQSITVEMSALVSAPGSGSAWTVGLSNGGNDTVAIGDLAMAGASEWTTTAITVPLAAGDDGSLANYLDNNGEMLITLTSASPDSTQVCGMVGGGGWPVHIGELVSTSPVPDVGVTISQIFRHGDLRRCPRAVKKIQAERDLRPAPRVHIARGSHNMSRGTMQPADLATSPNPLLSSALCHALEIRWSSSTTW